MGTQIPRGAVGLPAAGDLRERLHAHFRRLHRPSLALTVLGLALLAAPPRAWAAAPVAMDGGRFGPVTVYQSTGTTPTRAALLVVDGGWGDTAAGVACGLADTRTVVVTIDGDAYLKSERQRQEKCFFPAADFEQLGRFIENEVHFSTYVPPVLIGHATGGTLVYAAIAQAQPGVFAGAISLGFCPTIRADKPYCHGADLDSDLTLGGTARLRPARLESPWVVFQGTNDRVCDEKTVEYFNKQVFHGDFVLIHNVGHEFKTPELWMPLLRETFTRMTDGDDPTPPSADASTKGLPLVVLPAKGEQKDVFAVLITGDGGWAAIDRALARAFNQEGVSVVGLNSLKYFWKRKTPDTAGDDLERIVRHYFSIWNKKSVILVGYSRGADVMPFMANRLAPEILKKVSLIALLGCEKSVDFELHAGDVFNMKGYKGELPVLPEIEKLAGTKITCIWGSDDTDSLCHDLNAQQADVLMMKGGHHFGGDYKRLAREILQRAQ